MLVGDEGSSVEDTATAAALDSKDEDSVQEVAAGSQATAEGDLMDDAEFDAATRAAIQASSCQNSILPVHCTMLRCHGQACVVNRPAADQQVQYSMPGCGVMPFIHGRHSIHLALLAAKDE